MYIPVILYPSDNASIFITGTIIITVTVTRVSFDSSASLQYREVTIYLSEQRSDNTILYSNNIRVFINFSSKLKTLEITEIIARVNESSQENIP